MNSNKFSVLLVDDDQDVLDSYAHLMDISGINAKAVNDPTNACDHLEPDWPGVVLLDMYMPQMHGMELLAHIKDIDERIPVVVITGHGDIPMAVDAVKKGACEFLEKPINPVELLTLVKQHLEVRRAFVEQKRSVDKAIDKALIGTSAQMKQIREHVSQYALIDNHIVIWGESGSGRRSIAHIIHHMVNINHERHIQELRITEALSLDELDQAFKSCIDGTLILENLIAMSEPLQRDLIQLLLNQERCGTNRVRVITIFSEEPESLMASNSLLPELYYLLNQGAIQVPSLRQRPDDIASIFHYFLKQSCNKLGKLLPAVDSNYLGLLRAHDWPGNVRELRNVAELYAIGIVKLTGKERIYTQTELQSPLDELVDDYERRIIEDALFLHSGRVSDAANYLQIPRKKLYLRMKKHGIEKDDYKSR
ncbi:sigma-54-dependent transcriptional regulator [Vibrio sp. TRT 21S02]|uniref:sigma-54-dependent transcriptional regulator n=1 Tax=Vibrio sp. TRT 21S02 TaxID=3418507 RepID=UPI003CECE4F5